MPLQHRLGLEVEHRRGTRAGGDHRQQGVQVELRPLRHHEGLGQHLRVDRRQGVVDQLDHRPVALRAHVHDQLAERVEDRLGALEVARLAADHDGERAVLGPRPRTRDGRVEKRGAALVPEALGDRPRGTRRDRGHVDRQIDDRQALRRPVAAEQHVLQLGRVREHRDRQLGARGRAARRRRDPHALARMFGGELLGALARPVPDRHVKPRADQVGGHRAPHDPEPEERHSLDRRHAPRSVPAASRARRGRRRPASRSGGAGRGRAFPSPWVAAPLRRAGCGQPIRARHRPHPAGRGGAAP